MTANPGANQLISVVIATKNRKDIWQALYGFDEMLGAGGLLKSSSEGDIVIHSLHQGHPVGEMPNMFVTHNGFRA